MAGLLDFLNTDDAKLGIALLGAAGPSAVPMSFGQRLQGAMQTMEADKMNALKGGLLKAQVDNYTSEAKARDLQAQKMQGLMDFIKQKAQGATAAASAQSGQLGSGSYGIVPPPPGQPGIPAAAPAGDWVGKLSPSDVLYMKANGLDVTDLWKTSKEGIELRPGTFRVDAATGKREYIPDVKTGMTMGPNGEVQVLPGFLNAQTATTLATEAPKTLLNAAGTINLRKNTDGTESPVSVLAENPTLQNVLGGLFGGRMPGAAPAPAIPAAGSPGRPVVAAADQKAADAESIRMIQAELGNPNLPPDQKAGLQRELSRLQASQGQAGFPTPSLSPKYGVSTQQQIQNDADKETAIARAKEVAERRSSIMSAAFNAPANISRYQQIGKLLQDVDGGKLTEKGTEFASSLNSLGIKIDKNLPNKEAAAALANQAALELRNPAGGAGMPGALSDSDRVFLSSMTPNMAQTAQGRAQVINSYLAVQQRNMQVADFARKYEQKYGKLDNGFFDQLQQWSNANPIFKGQ